jgi:hypothetical protein
MTCLSPEIPKTMSLTRKLTAEFIGVFLIGAAVGGLVVWDLTDDKMAQFMSKTNDPDSVIVARVSKKYATEYRLTPDELQRIQPLIQDMAHQISQVRRQFGVDIMATIETYHQRIAQQLTPDHRAAYLAADEVRRKQMEKMFQLEQNPPDQTQK